MKLSVLYVILLVSAITLSSCKKSEPTEQPNSPEQKSEANMPATATGQTAESADESKGLVPIDIKLPKPMFIGTPQNIQVPNLETPSNMPRPAFLAPEGTVNAALGKKVLSSFEQPISGELEMITDGNKEGGEGNYIELGPGLQNVTIDLGEEYNIYAVVVWHFHSTARVYNDVVVQVSNDADFIMDAATIFNNDHDNSAGMGVGQDKNYVETSEGRLIDAKGVKGRYVRLMSNGNNANDLNHYIEVEVYGKPVK